MGGVDLGESDAKVMTDYYRVNIDEEGIDVEAAFTEEDIEFHELIAHAEGIDDIFTILHSESMAGNAERVRFIAGAYADQNILVKLLSNKETLFHIAADCGHTEVVEVLIDAARRLTSSSSSSSSSGDDITSFEEFIRQPNDSMNTALHLAVSNGHIAVAKLLVEADPSDRHIQNIKGETPIYLAAKLGNEEMVQMICRACTAPALAGPDGTTALHAAIMMLNEGKNEGLAVVKALIDAAKTSASSANRSYSSVRSFLGHSNEKDKDTALHLAVRRNHLGVAQHILDVDPSLLIINKQSDFKSTIYKAAEQGYTDMVTLLCGRYEGQNKLLHKGLTALCAAIIGRDAVSVTDILGSSNHLVTCDDDIGWTPLHYAAYYGFDSVLETIVKVQESVKFEAVYRKKIPTPLCVAAKEGHISTVIRLMELLPDTSIIANHEGQNILHLAAIQKNTELVHQILRKFPEKYGEKILNSKDLNGNTPLHLLICQGCFMPQLMHNNKWGVNTMTRINQLLRRVNVFLHAPDIEYNGNRWPVDTMTRNNKNWTPADMLYHEDQIIGHQLNIKKTIDQIRAIQPRWSEEKFGTMESLVPRSKRSKKDAEFQIVEEKLMKEESERYRELANSQVVVTALITAISFTVGFTMPGGLYQSGEPKQGMAILSGKSAFGGFIAADAMAFSLSACSLYFYYLVSTYNEARQIVILSLATKVLNMGSVAAMVLTFAFGTYLVLSHSPDVASFVVFTISLFFLVVIFMSIKSSRHLAKQKMKYL